MSEEEKEAKTEYTIGIQTWKKIQPKRVLKKWNINYILTVLYKNEQKTLKVEVKRWS